MGRTTGFDGLTLRKGIRAANLDRRHVLETFQVQPLCVQTDGTAASGVDTENNLLYTGQAIFEVHNIGTQTIIVPILEADGLEIGRDKTDNDGSEYSLGVTARSPFAFTIGTDRFFLKATLKIADVSGTDDTALGFRKAEAYQAAIDSYTDFAALNVIAGNVTIETANDDAATVVTDTTENWLDGEEHELGIYVSRGGVVTYEFDGAPPATVAAYTFDDEDVVVPFLYSIHATTTPGKIHISRWECGLQ